MFSHLYYCEEYRNKEILLIYTKYNFEKTKEFTFLSQEFTFSTYFDLFLCSYKCNDRYYCEHLEWCINVKENI